VIFLRECSALLRDCRAVLLPLRGDVTYLDVLDFPGDQIGLFSGSIGLI